MKKLIFSLLPILAGLTLTPASAQISPACQQWAIQGQPWTGFNASVYQFTPPYQWSPAAAIKGACIPLPESYPPYILPPPFGAIQIYLALQTSCTFGITADIKADVNNNPQGLGPPNFLEDTGAALRVTDRTLLHFTYSQADCGCYPQGVILADWDNGC